jgi:hypothetical protein
MRPFNCDVCGQSFGLKSDMKRHRLSVHPDAPAAAYIPAGSSSARESDAAGAGVKASSSAALPATPPLSASSAVPATANIVPHARTAPSSRPETYQLFSSAAQLAHEDPSAPIAYNSKSERAAANRRTAADVIAQQYLKGDDDGA